MTGQSLAAAPAPLTFGARGEVNADIYLVEVIIFAYSEVDLDAVTSARPLASPITALAVSLKPKAAKNSDTGIKINRIAVQKALDIAVLKLRDLPFFKSYYLLPRVSLKPAGIDLDYGPIAWKKNSFGTKLAVG